MNDLEGRAPDESGAALPSNDPGADYLARMLALENVRRNMQRFLRFAGETSIADPGFRVTDEAHERDHDEFYRRLAAAFADCDPADVFDG